MEGMLGRYIGEEYYSQFKKKMILSTSSQLNSLRN